MDEATPRGGGPEPDAAARDRSAVHDILYPGGEPCGSPGRSPRVREVAGELTDAVLFFARLVGGGVVQYGTYPGILVALPANGRIGLRPVSRSGAPTIDVHIADCRFKEIKFVGLVG